MHRLSRSGPALALAATVAILAGTSCTSPGAGPGGPAATVASTAPVAAAPGSARAYVPVEDPAKPAAKVRVREYWDFESDSPMEVENYESSFGADQDGDGNLEITVTSDVKLPTARTLALLQAEEEDSPLGDDQEKNSGGGEAAAEDHEADLAATEEFEDDVPAALDDDGDGDWDEDDDGYTDAYEEKLADERAEEYGEQEEAKLLSGPHKVTMQVEDLSYMGDENDTVWLRDEVTGQAMTLSHDQEWTHFTLKNDASTVTVVFNPDGTYMIDEQSAADIDAAVALMKASPVIQGCSRHSLAFLAARTVRVPEIIFRGPPQCINGLYRVQQAQISSVRRAEQLIQALLKALVSGEPQT